MQSTRCFSVSFFYTFFRTWGNWFFLREPYGVPSCAQPRSLSLRGPKDGNLCTSLLCQWASQRNLILFFVAQAVVVLIFLCRSGQRWTRWAVLGGCSLGLKNGVCSGEGVRHCLKMPIVINYQNRDQSWILRGSFDGSQEKWSLSNQAVVPKPMLRQQESRSPG